MTFYCRKCAWACRRLKIGYNPEVPAWYLPFWPKAQVHVHKSGSFVMFHSQEKRGSDGR